MFHGLCAHLNHGAHIAEQFAKNGFLVVGFDHRGFGKSEGIRGYLENLQIHLSDSRQFISKVVD
jgi:acylglycerol lipase